MPCPMPTPELVTTPAAEPVSLPELKAQCKIDIDDDDARLRSIGIAARQWFENALDRQLVTATWKVRYPYFPGWSFALPYPPLASITSVVYKDSSLNPQTLSSTYYDVLTWLTPGVIQLKNGFSWPATGTAPDAVVVTFVAGYGAASAVPELAKAGIKLLVEDWYWNYDAASDGVAKPVPAAVEAIVASARAYRF